MQRFAVSQFDSDTFVVVDRFENREMCVCGSYANGIDAEARARQIAIALNKEMHRQTKPSTRTTLSRRARKQ